MTWAELRARAEAAPIRPEKSCGEGGLHRAIFDEVKEKKDGDEIEQKKE